MRFSMRQAFLLTTFLGLPVSAFGADLEAASRIAKATVYTDGAAVVRSASVDLPAGASVIVLKGLPPGLDANSLHVEGHVGGEHGEAALTIVSIDNRVMPGEAKPSADPVLEARIEATRIERDRIRGDIEAAEAQKATIMRYASTSPEKLSPDTKPLDFEKWPEVWRMIGQGLTEVNERLRDLQQKNRTLESQLAAFERARPQAGTPGAPKRDVLVSVEADRAMKADLDIFYQVSSASWAPLYDARLKTNNEKPALDLVRRASVQQMTGEDWSGIGLTLSTVRLRHGTAARELATQSLTLVDLQADYDAAPKLSAPAPTRAMKVPPNAGAVAAAPPPVEEARPRLASVEAGAYETSFIVPGTVDIPRDGTIKSFALTTKTIEPTIGARLTPSLEASAYLEANFINEDEAPLLPGEVALWRDGNLIGKGHFALAAAGDKVKLGFGVDDQVKVTRAPTIKRDNDGGFFGSSRSETQDFKTTIKNLHRFPLRITMVDRIPVSENTAISVEPLSTNTAPTEKIVDDKRGVMGWTYDYKPGEQKDVRLGWRIRWPADRELRRQ